MSSSPPPTSLPPSSSQPPTSPQPPTSQSSSSPPPTSPQPPTSQSSSSQPSSSPPPPTNVLLSTAVSTVTTAAIPEIVNFTLNETLSSPGVVVTTQQGQSASGSEVTHVTFSTISNPENDAVNITENLGQVVESYYDNTANPNSESNQVLNDIKAYATQIKCENFHGKGTIEDYSELFRAASKIANETKQMQLNVDIDGFNEFGAAADELSDLFNGFIVKLQSINIIDDLNFLKSVRAALAKIARLSDVFGEFKKTIIATATVELPKSAHDARIVVEEVMTEVNCAMNYISHFVNPVTPKPYGSDLSLVEKNIIDKAVDTIENWSVLCDQGVSLAMNNSPDVVYIKSANQELKAKSDVMKANISSLRTKLFTYSHM